MRSMRPDIGALALLIVSLSAAAASAQPSRDDYERVLGLRARNESLIVNVPEPATWIGESARFWYRRAVKGGHEFIIVDAATLQKRRAFDHDRLAAALSNETGTPYTALTLPFNRFTFADAQQTIEFTLDQARWRC